MRKGQHATDRTVLAGTVSQLHVIGGGVAGGPRCDLPELAGAAQDAGYAFIEGVVVLARTNAHVVATVLRNVRQLLRAGFLFERHVDVDELPSLGQLG